MAVRVVAGRGCKVRDLGERVRLRGRVCASSLGTPCSSVCARGRSPCCWSPKKLAVDTTRPTPPAPPADMWADAPVAAGFDGIGGANPDLVTGRCVRSVTAESPYWRDTETSSGEPAKSAVRA